MYKTAVFVFGPESSGTRMTTRFLIKAGFWGDGDHGQRLDNLNFFDRPDRIVFRRSVPHGGQWPLIVDLTRRMERASYKVLPVFTWRDPPFMAASQVRAGHTQDKTNALTRIERAVYDIHDACEELGTAPYVITYEAFVRDANERALLCNYVGALPPTFEVYDANKKYTAEQRQSYSVEAMNKVLIATQECDFIFQGVYRGV